MERKNIYSGTPWEEQVAYCRAKRIGDHIVVAGTTSVAPDGEVVGSDTYEQTLYAFRKSISALEELGGSVHDVIRTRMFVTNIDDFDQVAKAHKEVFSGVDPVATCVEVTRLVDEKLLIEVEVDAISEVQK